MKKVQKLSEIGGHTLKEVVKRVLEAVVTNELAKQINLSGCGKCGKKRFSGTNLYDTVFSKYSISYSPNCHLLSNVDYQTMLSFRSSAALFGW